MYLLPVLDADFLMVIMTHSTELGHEKVVSPMIGWGIFFDIGKLYKLKKTKQRWSMTNTYMYSQIVSIWIKYDSDRSTTHPKFGPTGVRTHDLQIMTVHFMSLRRLLYPRGHQWLLLCTPSLTQQGSNSWPPDHDSTFHVTEVCSNHLAISDFIYIYICAQILCLSTIANKETFIFHKAKHFIQFLLSSIIHYCIIQNSCSYLNT